MRKLKRLYYSLIASLCVFGNNVLAIGGFQGQRTDTNPDVPGSTSMQGEGFLSVVQRGINWVLALLGMIALIILLWGGFQMVTAAGDDNKYQNGFKILKQAGIGLIVIGVAWFVISLIFSVIGQITGDG